MSHVQSVRLAKEPARRLFFALWPDEVMREAMVHATREAVAACGGRPVPAANLHVTLAFLGSVPERRLPQLVDVARRAAESAASVLAIAAAPADPLELTVDHLEYWRAAQLLCALPSAPQARTVALARRLRQLLSESAFARDRESPGSVGADTARRFRPHVTLARKVRRPPRAVAMPPVTWGLADFVLVDSKTLPEGSVYTVLERFSVAG